MATAHDFVLPITHEKNLREFVQLAFGVKIPSVVHPDCRDKGHCSPWRAFADAYFAKDSIAVWHASRGFGGKSFLLALLGLVEAVTLKCDVSILGGSGEQAQRVHEHMQAFWNYGAAPTYLLASDPSKRETKLTWGNTVRALMASQRSVRGPHPVRLRNDETDLVDLAILDAAMGQTMSRNGVAAQMVLSSTHQNPDGTFTEVLRRAAANKWPIHRWCWRETSNPEDGWLAVEEVARKKSEVTAEMFRVEYELAEPNPASHAIDSTACKRAFNKSLGTYAGEIGEYIEVEEPNANGSYATGADWAKEQDFTVITTLRTDVHPMRCVAFKRTRRQPWPAMVENYNRQVNRFPGESCHDKTGLGGVIDDYIDEGIGITLSGRTRQDMLSDYIGAIERGEIVYPFIRWAENEHRMASVDAVYGSLHLPDSICAGALANKAAGDIVTVGRV